MLLEVKDLKMHYSSLKGWIRAVDGVSFSVDQGETLGIVGESGCGKSSCAKSIMKLLPSNGQIIEGQILFNGLDIATLPGDELRKLRWSEISMIFQSAMNALNPVFRVKDQLIEALRAHANVTKDEAERKVVELFDLVGIPRERLGSYPHQYSGGMKQRAIIAMSLICNPSLIIADEPTTALDVVVQDSILQRINDLQQKIRFALIMISHDISIIAETCQRAAVMYAGKILEIGSISEIFSNPRNPYTVALLRAFPSIHGPVKRLEPIKGSLPSLLRPPSGCRFEPRCPLSKEICKKEEPPPVKLAAEHFSYCHFAEDVKIEST